MANTPFESLDFTEQFKFTKLNTNRVAAAFIYWGQDNELWCDKIQIKNRPRLDHQSQGHWSGYHISKHGLKDEEKKRQKKIDIKTLAITVRIQESPVEILYKTNEEGEGNCKTKRGSLESLESTLAKH